MKKKGELRKTKKISNKKAEAIQVVLVLGKSKDKSSFQKYPLELLKGGLMGSVHFNQLDLFFFNIGKGQQKDTN